MCNDIVVLRHTTIMNVFIVDIFNYYDYRTVQMLNLHERLVQARV